MEQGVWCYTEELQALTSVVHSLESRLIVINQDREAEKQKLTQEVNKLSEL